MANDNDRLLRPLSQQNMTPPAVPKLPDGTSPESYAQMLGILRDIRAEVQNLQRTLRTLAEKGAMVDGEVREQEVRKLLQTDQPIYAYNERQIEARLNELRTLLRNAPGLYDRYGDEITHIENFWERAQRDWPAISTEVVPDAPVAAEAIVRAAKVLDYTDSIIYHVGLLTIPGRLNQHLEQLRIGQKLDFNATFSDEVPDTEDRRKILEYLDARPMVVRNGIIDLAAEGVYHASPYRWRRNLSYLFVLLTVATGAVLVYLIGETAQFVPDWFVEPGRTTELLVEYLFIIIGGVVHLGVDAVKQARSTPGGKALVVEDWLLWVHIHEVGVIIGILSLWVGFAGLLLLSSATAVDWETAFLIGYSIDSFVDLFLQRFDAGVLNRSTALRGRV
ncbi:MAG: hypothetical protein SF029_22415 [bacterium]|nr:hypothetical protein [bacterium]